MLKSLEYSSGVSRASRLGQLPPTAATNETALKDLPTIEDYDLPIDSVYRKHLPDMTTARKMAAATLEPSPLGGDTTEYIKDAVPASPTADIHGPKTRLRARLSSLVVPEPCTDIESEMEAAPVQPQGRPARRGKATASA